MRLFAFPFQGILTNSVVSLIGSVIVYTRCSGPLYHKCTRLTPVFNYNCMQLIIVPPLLCTL